MGISVVIPCLNEENYLSDCIESLVHNGFPLIDLELLIVDGGSSDNTLNIIEDYQDKFPFVKLVENKKRKTPFALNLGIKNATQPYILIAGAHAIYPKGYLQLLFNEIQKPEIDVVGGAIETKVKNQNSKSNAIVFVLSHRMGVGNSQFRIGGDKIMQVDTVPFGLYKKEVFEKAGFYNEKLIRNHDIELSRRIKATGFSIWLVPSVKVTYFARENYCSLAKNQFGNGLWNVKTLLITKRFSSLSLRHYIPLFFVLSILLPLLMGLIIHPIFYFIALVSVVLYFFTVGVLVCNNRSKVNPVHLIWSFMVLHFSYGFGSLCGFFSLTKSSR